MKKLIYILLALLVANILMALEPELYSPEGVEFSNETFLINEIFLADDNFAYKVATDEMYNGEIWKFDGTKEGMERITNLPEGAAPKLIEIVNGNVLFFTQSNEGETVDIWSTNGVDEEVKLIDGFDYRYDEFMGLIYTQSFSFNGFFYLNVYNREKKLFELWRTDGTKEGTLNYSEENNIYDLTDFYHIDDRIVTIGYSDALPGESSKRELYSTDFNNERIKLAEFEHQIYPMIIYDDKEIKSKMFFYHDHSDVNKAAIWVTDGTTKGTFKFKEFSNYDNLRDWPKRIVKYGENYLITYREYDQDLNYAYKVLYTDGTVEKTLNLSDIVGANSDLDINGLGKVGDKFLLEASDYKNDQRYIWSTDGTEEGTNLLITAKHGGGISFC